MVACLSTSRGYGVTSQHVLSCSLVLPRDIAEKAHRWLARLAPQLIKTSCRGDLFTCAVFCVPRSCLDTYCVLLLLHIELAASLFFLSIDSFRLSLLHPTSHIPHLSYHDISLLPAALISLRNAADLLAHLPTRLVYTLLRFPFTVLF